MKYSQAVGRGLGLVLMGVLAWHVLRRGLTPAPSGTLLSLLDGANLIFHEAGHVLFLFFGEFLRILGGSFTQVTIPAVCAGYFVRRHQLAAVAATLFWTGQSVTGVAIYIADARRLALPLLGGEGVIHDWNYLLGRLHLIGHADLLGRLVFTLGVITILVALGLLTVDLMRNWHHAAVEE